MKRYYDFTENVKREAFFRQWNKCAHCGEELIDIVDHAHHVVPNQLGNKNNPADEWIKSADNCVILCEDCHERVHENGSYRIGVVAPPDYYPYSHGNNKAGHYIWLMLMKKRFWER